MVEKGYDVDAIMVQLKGTGIWLKLKQYHMGYQQQKRMTVTIDFDARIDDPTRFIPRPGNDICVRFSSTQAVSFVEGKAHAVKFYWTISDDPELQFDIVSVKDITKDHERWFPLMVEEAARMKRLGLT